MAIDDVFRLTIQCAFSSNIYMNTYHFRSKREPAMTVSDFQTLADRIKETVRPTQMNSISYTYWRAIQVYGAGVTWPSGECRPEGGLTFDGVFTGTTTGSNVTGDVLPPQCALVETLVTGQVGRRKRGRIYHFGFGEGDQAAGVWVSALLTPVRTALTTFFGLHSVTGTNPDFTIGVWSFRTASGCTPNPNGPGHIQVNTPAPQLAFTPCTTYRLNDTVFTQRRRVRGVGR